MPAERENEGIPHREIILEPGQEVRLTLPSGEEIIFKAAEPQVPEIPQSVEFLAPHELREAVDDLFLKYSFEVVNLRGSEEDRDAFFARAKDSLQEITEILDSRNMLNQPEKGNIDPAKIYFERRAKAMFSKSISQALAEAHGRSVLEYLRENFDRTKTED